MDGRADDALEFAESRATEPITAVNAKWHITKASALASRRQFSKAREVLTTVLHQNPTNAEVLLTLAELYEATGEDAEAANSYEQALKNATGAEETRVRYMFGGFSARLRQHGRAVELWRPLVRRDKPNTLLDTYVRVLYNSGGLTEITEIAEDLKKSGEKISEMCTDVISATYQRLDDLNEANAWLEYLCDNYQNKPEYVIRLSNIKFRLGKRDEALELLDASKSRLENASDLMGYAQTYSTLGKHSEAIELGRKAVSAAQDNPDIAMGYVGIFLAAGESFEKTPEQITTFKEIFSTFKEKFPTSPHLQSFPIDPDHPLDAIRDTLIRLSEQARDVLQLYRENRMPLQMFANLLSRDLYETWIQVVSDPELSLLSSAGNEDEQQEFQRALAAGTAFILEPVALFTFTYLGLLDKLLELGDLYIAQGTLDYLHEIQGQRKVMEQSQRGTMGMVDGQFFMHEVTATELEKMNTALNTATEWSERHTKSAGLKAPFTSDDKKWSGPIGQANVSSLVIANQRGFVLVTDDKTLGDIGKQNYGIAFVNSQAVLLYLLNTGLLTQGEYDKAILKLVEAGYIFTKVEERQLFEVIVDEQFQITPRLKRVIRVLEPAAILLPSACFAVASLLRRIYLEPIPDELRNALAFYMLDTLAKNHPKIEVQRLVRAFLRQQMGTLLVLQLKTIEQVLDRW